MPPLDLYYIKQSDACTCLHNHNHKTPEVHMRAKLMPLIAVILLFSGGVGSAQEQEATTAQTSFIYKEGHYLWDVWRSPMFRQQYSWTEFWHTVSRLNDIPLSLDAYRSIPAGTELIIPVPNVTVADSERVDSLQSRISSLQAEIEDLQQKQAEAVAESREPYDELFVILVASLILLLCVIVFLVYLYRRKSSAHEEVQGRVSSYENLFSPEEAHALHHYADENLVRIDLREISFVYHEQGDRFYYLEKTSGSGTGQWVRTRTGHRFKLKNLKSQLDTNIEEFPELHKTAQQPEQHEVVA